MFKALLACKCCWCKHKQCYHGQHLKTIHDRKWAAQAPLFKALLVGIPCWCKHKQHHHSQHLKKAHEQCTVGPKENFTFRTCGPSDLRKIQTFSGSVLEFEGHKDPKEKYPDQGPKSGPFPVHFGILIRIRPNSGIPDLIGPTECTLGSILRCVPATSDLWTHLLQA